MDSLLAGFQDLIGQSYGKPALLWVGVQTQGFQRSFPNTISMVLQYCDANFYGIKTVDILEMSMSLKSTTLFLG